LEKLTAPTIPVPDRVLFKGKRGTYTTISNVLEIA